MGFDGVFMLDSQYAYANRGPFDAKMLVETFDDLIEPATWTDRNGNILAYRGMIVAVRKGSATYPDSTGVYFFNDGQTKKSVTAEEIADAERWKKLCSLSDVSDFADRLTAIESELVSIDERLTALESEEKVHTYGYKDGFPAEGVPGHMYVAADLKRTYVYVEGTGYVLVGAGFEENEDGDLLINGGTAD